MLWVEAHRSLLNSSKTARLAEVLKISRNEAIGTVLALWWFAAEHHPDGDLTSASDAAICAAVGRKTRPPSRLMAAFIEAGFVDANRKIHDWQDYSGRRHRAAVKNKARMAERRRADRAAGMCETSVTHVCHTSSPASAPSSLPPFLPPYISPIISPNTPPPPSPPSQDLSSSSLARAREEEGAAYLATCAALLGKKYWGRELTSYEIDSIVEMVALHARRRMGLRDMIPSPTEDDTALLEIALEASARAGKCQVNYLAGVYIKFGENRIYTESDYWDRQIERDK